MPTRRELSALVHLAGQAPGYAGPRNEAFFRVLAESGARVNALRELDGANCVVMPNGGLRIFLHEKGKAEAREVELSRTASDGLRVYVAAFNLHAAVRRWAIRLHPGEPGSMWRNSARGRWAYNDVRSTLRAACAAARVPDFTPHALRRAFATDAASLFPRHVVAAAGGWNGLERLDDHYVHARRSTIWEKLWRGSAAPEPERVQRNEDHAAALAL